MTRDRPTRYTEAYYSRHGEGMSKSAAVVLGVLYEYYTPQSVIDVGCGPGAWLASAESLGSRTLRGLDGEWVRTDALLSKKIEFSAVDFEDAMPHVDARYDLCISLEVAEHLAESNARRFVDFLCKASATVLFSAAIKNQGGTRHINEQWQSYWIDLFAANGYECIDLFRPRLWNDDSVEWWYRQNTFLFVDPNGALANLDALRASQKPIFDIAHPRNYEIKAKGFWRDLESPSLRTCLECFGRYIRNTLP